MKNYQNSDYALNKMNEDAIVYRTATGIVKITLADYLAENPDKTEADFRALKELSDEDYRVQDRDDYNQTWKNVSIHGLDETEACSVPSPEDEVIERPERAAKEQQRRKLAKQALETLSTVQRRRYLLHVIDGLSTRDIAEREGVSHIAIVYSLELAEKKIKKLPMKIDLPKRLIFHVR